MKEKQIFYNPFRLISPTVNAEASRIRDLVDARPEDITCLEEGMIVMCNKLIEMTELLHKDLLVHDPAKIQRCEQLAREVHGEEKGLTDDLVCHPETPAAVLRTVVLFPGRLERVGDLLESICNVCRIKSRDGIPFSERAQREIDQLFDLFADMLRNFRDVLTTRNRLLLEHIIDQGKEVTQRVLDFNLAHEERLCEGFCSPKASSLYLDLLDSIRYADHHLMDMAQALLSVSETSE